MATNAIELRPATKSDSLFALVGAFLTRNRLSPLPAHYAFAYEVVTHPDGAVARVVSELTDGGFRLTERDIARLTRQMTGGREPQAPTPTPPLAVVADPEPENARADSAAAAMIERALMQLDGFADMVSAVHADTNDFGRDLARSAEAISAAGPAAGLDEIARLTASMIQRVREAEVRLERARRESDELKVALDEAQGSARTDALTELANRRAFDETFGRLAPDAMISVVICDIDHFKRVNDTFGHAVGDRVLRAVAQALTSEQGYFVARYGGEEFALIFEGRSAQQATAVVDRLRVTLGERRLKLRESGEPVGPISFSAGVANGPAGEGRSAMMARADAALYRAKGLGRARTEIAP